MPFVTVGLEPEYEDEDEEPAGNYGIDAYPAHIPMGLPLPDRFDKPDHEYSL